MVSISKVSSVDFVTPHNVLHPLLRSPGILKLGHHFHPASSSALKALPNESKLLITTCRVLHILRLLFLVLLTAASRLLLPGRQRRPSPQNLGLGQSDFQSWKLNWRLTTIPLQLGHHTSPLASLQSKSSDEDVSLSLALPPTHHGGKNNRREFQCLLVLESARGRVNSNRQGALENNQRLQIRVSVPWPISGHLPVSGHLVIHLLRTSFH
jgi:hypothetical protein